MGRSPYDRNGANCEGLQSSGKVLRKWRKASCFCNRGQLQGFSVITFWLLACGQNYMFSGYLCEGDGAVGLFS